MWMIDPTKLCKNHLCGEHRELHALVGMINKDISLKGYINNGLIEVHNIRQRHSELAAEMLRRKYYHKSPLPFFIERIEGVVDTNKSIEDLKSRCPECRRNLVGLK